LALVSFLQRTGAVTHPLLTTRNERGREKDQVSQSLPEVWENKQEAASRASVTPAEAYTSEVEQDTRLVQILAVQQHDLLAFADSGRSAGIHC